MDKKISIRLREDEYREIVKCAKEKGKSVSWLVRSRVLAVPEQGRMEATNEMKIQLLKIRAHIHDIALTYPKIDLQPIDDIMEVFWDELY